MSEYPISNRVTTPRDQWNKCALCGKTVHPWQETSAAPLAEGIACVSCAYDRVDATRQNKGIPSHKVTSRNKQTGKWETKIVRDKIILEGKKEDEQS